MYTIPKSNFDYEHANKVLEVKNLRVSFKSDSGMVYAVRGVSFDLYKGETLCIVGESGSGKSVTSKTIMGILPVNAVIDSGQILYNGEDLVRVSEEEFHRIRGHKIGMIFQDPLSSLNPIMKVGKQIIEATMVNRNVLKRRFAEEVSKETTALHNEEANFSFEKKQVESEIETLKRYRKDFERAIKADIKNFNNEKSSELNEKVKEYFNALRVNSEFKVASFKDEIAAIKKLPLDEKIEVNNSIRVKKIELLEYFIEHFNEQGKQKYQDFDVYQATIERQAFLKKYIARYHAIFKEIHPLLREALNVSKKLAKASVDEYHQNLIVERNEKLDELNAKLQEAQINYKELYATLTDEEKGLFSNYLKSKKTSIFKSFFKKEDLLTGIAKATKKEEKEVVISSNVEFDAAYLKKVEIENKIKEVKEDFISKTKITKNEAKKIALSVMREVGIPLPEKRFKQYPFEFSGGMRQRIVIAIALTANPDILICDEPTTALDVTIQAQILELINKLKRERGLSCIFITHDLGVVANMADRVAVMYAGKIVEYGTSYEVFFDPKHPYTWALLSSIPDIDSKEKLESIPGTPPDMRFPPKGDAFALRSKYAMDIDFKYEPPYFKVSPTHYAATWLLHEKAPKVEMPKIVRARIENALRGEGLNNGRK